MGKISVVFNVVDEEIEVLPRALDSVKNLADEIVIVDSTSKGLKDIADKHSAKIYQNPRSDYVEKVRNFGISKASGDWILIMDPDEEVPESLAKKIKNTVQVSKVDYCSIPRKNLIFGKWMKHSRWWPDYNIRLFKKGKVFWNEVIHTVPMTIGNGADMPAKEELAIIHHHYDSIEQYVERMNRYTFAHARLLVKGGYKFYWKDLITKPSDEFLSRYFFGEGYKDGVHGLAVCLLQGASELVMYLKTWQLSKFVPEEVKIKEVIKTMRNIEKDNHYWQADTAVKQSGGILPRIRRKLKI